MAAASSLAWRQRFPGRALRRLGWYVLGGGALVAGSWLLFGGEPARLEAGELNPLALVPLATTALAGAGAAPFAVALVRRPRVTADHYALGIRPGMVRTLLLPWVTVAEITAVDAAGEPLLLVRTHERPGHATDRPHWCDRAVLRAAGHAGAGYHLAVRMTDFAGDPARLLDSLAGWAPERVAVVNRLPAGEQPAGRRDPGNPGPDNPWSR